MRIPPTITHRQRRRRAPAGLTLVEILVSIALLLVIVVGLTAMFNQTQRAFRSSLSNVDVLEGGRAAADMIARDLEQMRPYDQSATVTNYFSDLQTDPTKVVPINLPMPGGSLPPYEETGDFTNLIQKVFFMTGLDEWEGLGFRVLNPNDPDSADTVLVGSLYRFNVKTNAIVDLSQNGFFRVFTNSPQALLDNTNLHRIVDGVIHFSVRAYDTNGVAFGAPGAATPTFIAFNNGYRVPTLGFANGQVPAYVELEIGIIEPQVVQQVRPILNINPAGASAFLATNAAKIHYFRQQIPIRTARQ